MSNEYLILLEQQAGALRKEQENPYLRLLDESQRAQDQALRGNLSGTINVNPDQFATKKRVAEYLGYPTPVVEAQPGLETQAKIQQVDQATQGAPVLRQKYTDADFAKLAHDDSGVLATIESVVKYLVSAPRTERTLMGDIGAGVQRANRGAAGAFQAAAELAAPIFDLPILPENPLRRMARSMAATGAESERKAKELSPPTNDIVAGGISSGVQSLTQNVMSLPLAFLNPAAALTSMATTTAGDAYQKAREKGLTPGESLPFAASQGVIEYATEKIPMSRLLGDLARNASLRQVLMRQIAAEVPGEQVATILQDMNEWAVLNPEKPFSSYLAERPSAAAQTLIATIVGVGGNVALARTLEAVLVPAEVRARRAEAAEQTAQMLEQLDALMRAAKLRDRDAPTFEQFIAEVEKDGPADTVYIPAQVLFQTGVADALAQVSPSIAQQLQTPLASSGYVAIPVSEYLTRIAGTEYSQGLIDHLKVDPNGMSRAEATQHLSEYQEKLKEQVEAALGERAADATWRESAEKVRAEIRDSLNAAGAYRTDVNDAGALLASSWYATMAAKLGMTPEQMYKKMPLFVRSQWMPGEQVLDQVLRSRLGMNFRDVIKRTPELQAAIQQLQAGQITREEFNAAVETYKPVKPYAEVPLPATTEQAISALRTTNAEKAGTPGKDTYYGTPSRTLKEGDAVGLRLDIPSYSKTGTWVVTVHGPRKSLAAGGAGARIGYESVAAVTNVQFGISEKAAAGIAAGKEKTTIATMEGKWKPVTPEQAKAEADAALNDPAWVQVGMDPERHSYFYDRNTMQPVVAADEVIQIGPLVLAKNPTYAPRSGFLYQSLPTQIPSLKGLAADPNVITVPGLSEALRPGGETQLAANVNLFNKKTQIVADKEKRGYDSIVVQGDTPGEKAESIIGQMVRNLLTIFDAIPEAILARSRLWYVGANRISLAFAQRYDITPMQSAGMLAVTSPQADWRMNVSYVERILDILTYRQDHVWDDAMTAWADGFIEGKAKDRARALEEKKQAVKDARAELRQAQSARDQRQRAVDRLTPKVEKRIGAAEGVLEQIKPDLTAAKRAFTKAQKGDDADAIAAAKYAVDKAQAKVDAQEDAIADARRELRLATVEVSKADTTIRRAESKIAEKEADLAAPDYHIAMQPLVRGKRLADLQTDEERAWWIRAYDEAHNPRTFRDVTPEGGFLDFVKLESGKGFDSIAWKSFSAIEKAVAIARDGSVANVMTQLGGEHKVRNFYNNIFAPDAPYPFVTSDTHQVAANLFLPLGADALEVAQNFGGAGAKDVSAIGLNGTYWLYSEAVRRAAKAREVLPREMQSISWEAIRSLFSATFKQDRAKVDQVRDLWVEHAAGRATYEQTIDAIVRLAGGYTPPSWVGVGPDSAVAPEAGNSSYESQLSHGRQGLAGRDGSAGGIAGLSGPALPAVAQNQFAQSEQDGPLGTFNPATNTITLRKRANLSTFPHELGHFFLEAQFAITAELKAKAEKDGIESLTEGEREILRDTEALLKWLGEQDHVAAFNSLRQMADGLEREAKTNPQVVEQARLAREAYEYADERGREGFMKEVAETWGQNVPAELRFYLLTPYHEYWARGFENYLYEGKAPSVELQSLFQKFRAFILSAYRRLLAAAKGGMPEVLNVRLTDNARRIMDRMLATTEQIKLAEQSRSMIPLWSTPEQAGMTPERFAAYQAQFLEGTQEAIQDLQARALRDLAWTRNARGREIRRLQRQERERRRELTIEVRREVMSDPVYRAWQFLTAKIDRDNMTPGQAAADQYRKDAAAWRAQRRGVEETARHEVETQAWDASEEGQKKYRKLSNYEKAKRSFLKAKADEIDAAVAARMAAWEKANPEPEKPAADGPPKSSPDRVDETIDSLFVAIAKLGGLNKEEVTGTWGTDPADKPASGVFGKPVWRVEGGLSIDAMAEALVQYGYLTPDENGKPDLRELEDKFRDELAGEAQYSFSHTPYVEMPAGSEIANPAGLTAGRLDVDSLRAMGIPLEITDFIVGLKMTSKNGLHPDVVADIIVMEDGSPAFSSGDELVRSLAAAQPPREEIESRVDQRMLEQYGELATPEAIERAADEAIHNEARARFIATEANALAEATGQPKVLAAAARAFAAQVIARLRIRDIRPAQYAAAEARAAGAAAAASRAGDLPLAAAEKRNQVAQNYATREAYAALDEVERGVRFLRKFDREGTRKGLDREYLDQIDAILERFDLRPTSIRALERREGLRAWVEKQRAQGIEPAIPEDILEEAFRTSYKNLTMEEFRGLLESVKQIEHLGRLKKRLLAAQDQREYEAIRDEIAGSIVANAGDRKADTRTPTTMLGRRLQKIRQFGAEHIKAATWARVFDGGKDGGPFWEYIIRPANERADMETTMRAEATLRLSEILSPVFKLGKMGGKGTFFPTIGGSLNREARLAIALNVGNEGNLQRLLGGEGWTFAQIQPVLQSLTEAEWRAVQQVWDYLDSFRPMIAAKERRVYGVEPDWVVPTPFTMTTADGKQIQLQGGYYPIKYDPAASQRAEENADAEAAREMLQGAFTSATTRRSFTKARANEVVGRPLLYSLEGVYAGVNEVIHDLAWHEWLIDTNRLLRSDTIDRAIREHYGPEAKAQLKAWVKRIADGDKTVDQAGEAVMGRLRQGISAAGLGFNVMSAALQVLGFTQSIVRVGAPWVGRGIAQYIASPIASSRQVVGKSAFMAARSRTRFRELSELRDRVQDESDTMRGIKAGTFFLMSRAQQMVDVPTWIGAYEKAISEGNEETRAIALADQAVIDAQGGGQTKDQAAIEGGHAFRKLFTVFYSFMNTTLNLATGKTMTARTPAQRARLAVDYLMLFTVPAVLGAMLKDALTPGGDDDDWEQLARKLAAEQLSYLMGLMVFVREAQGLAKIVMGAEGVRGYEGPAGLRFFPDLYKLATQANQGEFDDAFRKAAINVVGDLTGLPAAQINRTWTGIEALAEGETDNPAAVVFGFQRQ